MFNGVHLRPDRRSLGPGVQNRRHARSDWRLQMQMTNGGSSGPTLANSMGRFDLLQLERDIAEKQYGAAAAAFEASRVQLDSQQVYLATFLQPVLAQEATVSATVVAILNRFGGEFSIVGINCWHWCACPKLHRDLACDRESRLKVLCG